MFIVFLHFSDSVKMKVTVKGTVPLHAKRLVFKYPIQAASITSNGPEQQPKQVTVYAYFNVDDTSKFSLNLGPVYIKESNLISAMC